MKDQVVLSKANDQIAIAVPLFRVQHDEVLEKMSGYSIQLTNSKPIAYALECFDEVMLVSASFAEKNLEWLGEL